MHIAPNGGIGVVLKKHVVVAFPIDWTVGIVHPVGGGEQMKLRSKRIGSKRGVEIVEGFSSPAEGAHGGELRDGSSSENGAGSAKKFAAR
jgi:hypothetical protein